MVAFDAFPVREPVSKRAYTCLRLRTRSGTLGYGECSRLSPVDLTVLRGAIQGKEAAETWNKHLYVAGDGLFHAAFNEPEMKVLNEEISRKEVVAWH